MSGETQNMKTITLKQCSLMLVTVTLLIGLVQASENVYAAGDTIPLQYHCDCYHNATQKKILLIGVYGHTSIIPTPMWVRMGGVITAVQ